MAAPTFLDRALGGRLWRDRGFLLLWTGQAVSEAGTQVTALALPSVAILVLHAGAFQVGTLAALEFLAFPVLGLIAGVYADRLKRRPIMIVCDLARLLLIASVPVAALLHVLAMNQLYVVALLVGIANVFFDVSYQSYLPALIPRTDLVEGNSKLEVSRSAAQLAGPALAGFLIQAIGAVESLWVDAASFPISAASLFGIRKPEPAPQPGTAAGESGFWREMWEGIQVVIGNPTLWKIAGCTATSNLGSNMIWALFLLFAYRTLGLSPSLVGLIFAGGAVGGLLGALSAGAVTRRLGLGLTLFVTITTGGLAAFLIPLAQLGLAVPLLVISTAVSFLCTPIYNIGQVSLRQAITPDRVQGRMNATMRTVVWGTLPVGAFLGGILGSVIGILPTMYIGAAVTTAAAFWILLGPIRLKEAPAPVA